MIDKLKHLLRDTVTPVPCENVREVLREPREGKGNQFSVLSASATLASRASSVRHRELLSTWKICMWNAECYSCQETQSSAALLLTELPLVTCSATNQAWSQCLNPRVTEFEVCVKRRLWHSIGSNLLGTILFLTYIYSTWVDLFISNGESTRKNGKAGIRKKYSRRSFLSLDSPLKRILDLVLKNGRNI